MEPLKFDIMEIVKGILIIVGVVGLGTYLLRLLWQTISKEAESIQNELGPVTSENLDLDTGATKYDKAGVVHPPQVFINGEPLEGVTNFKFKDVSAAIDYANKLAEDRKNNIRKRANYISLSDIPVKSSTSNDGFIWTESETMSNDSFDSLYHTSHTIDDSPSFGNGGDFGGGGASGSWDSSSSSDISYDSGSSDSGSSWND